jgi:hypothetical protein
MNVIAKPPNTVDEGQCVSYQSGALTTAACGSMASVIAARRDVRSWM